MVKEAEAKARFLNSAAYLYSCSSPAVSAHLLLQHNIFAMESGMSNSTNESSPACGACGTIDLHAQNARTLLNHRVMPSTPRKPSRKAYPTYIATPSNKQIQDQCKACKRFIRQSLPSTSRGPTTVTRPLQPATPNAASSSVSTSSKRRPKNRSRGSLQASLAKSSQRLNEDRGYGIDLMGFMQKV